MFTTDYNTNIQIISDALRSEQSFDLVKRDLIIADRKAALFFIDGLLKDDITEKILEFFYKNVKSENFKSALYFAQSSVPYVEVEVTSDLKKICTDVLSGISALIIEGFTEVILLDTRTYLKLARYFITIVTVLITPLWLLALQNPDYCPEFFRFVLLDEPQNIPVFWQLILMEVGIDGLRLAALNTPNSLTTPLSIIGAIALSEFAVESGWVSMKAILYMALVTVANFTQPNFELGYSFKFCRVLLLVLTYIFNVWGFIIAFIINLVLLCTNRTLSSKSYLYPLVPFNGKEFLRKILRIRDPR